MAELDGVAVARIELADDRAQPGGGVVETGRELEKKAAHMLVERVGELGELKDQRLCAPEPLHVRDALVDLDAVLEAGHRLARPGYFEPPAARLLG
jgi:hypothetical protein